MAATISRETAKTLQDSVTMIKEISVRDKKIQERYARMSEGLRRGMENHSEEGRWRRRSTGSTSSASRR